MLELRGTPCTCVEPEPSLDQQQMLCARSFGTPMTERVGLVRRNDRQFSPSAKLPLAPTKCGYPKRHPRGTRRNEEHVARRFELRQGRRDTG